MSPGVLAELMAMRGSTSERVLKLGATGPAGGWRGPAMTRAAAAPPAIAARKQVVVFMCASVIRSVSEVGPGVRGGDLTRAGDDRAVRVRPEDAEARGVSLGGVG